MFLKELRAELGTEYGVTATLPVSYRYLQHFDTKTLAEHLDWIHMQSMIATTYESLIEISG